MKLNDFQFPPNSANPAIVGPLGTQEDVSQGLNALGLSDTQDIPDKWDWREKYNLLEPSNQLHCGNCWAHSSTNALTDKFIILKKLIGLELDQLLTTVCVPEQNNMCNGGVPYYAGKWFETSGGMQGDSPNCPMGWKNFCAQANGQMCLNTPIALPTCQKYSGCLDYQAMPGSTQTLAVAKNDGSIDPDSTVHNIKLAIMNTGPVVATFAVLADFMYGTGKFIKNSNGDTYNWDATNGIYVNGAYDNDLTSLYGGVQDPDNLANLQKLVGALPNPNWSALDGWHAVEVVGWDSTGPIPFWIVKNSWGPGWNEGGYWRHAIYPKNMAVYFDVPQDNQGTGGCTNFQINQNTGGQYGTKVGNANSGGEITALFSSKNVKTLLLVLAGIFILVGLFYLVKFMFGGISGIKFGKRKGSY